MRARPLRSVTPDESAAFHRDGAVLLQRVLSPEWIEAVEKGLETVVEKADVLSESLGTLRVDQFPAARAKELRRVIEESPIAEIVGTALQSPVRFYMDQSFVKPPGLFLPTPWHQDTCYYNIGGHDLIRAWVSCDPVPRNVSLEVVRGSHLWNVTYSPLAGRDPEFDPSAQVQIDRARVGEPMLGVETYADWTYWSGVKDKTLPLVPEIETQRDSYDILGWDYEPGDVILFHGHILHSALGNVESEIPRRAHASLWAGRDAHYLHRVGQIIPDPIALYPHKPKTGQLLSDFPEVFPLAWSPDEA
ncbi:MAG: phytanoyl-CoA dioxygenase family protein [Myxococcota bacterium]|nr:phytanoyl-CoA dioxygenase family protein [Myxococcota bacterium]